MSVRALGIGAASKMPPRATRKSAAVERICRQLNTLAFDATKTATASVPAEASTNSSDAGNKQQATNSEALAEKERKEREARKNAENCYTHLLKAAGEMNQRFRDRDAVAEIHQRLVQLDAQGQLKMFLGDDNEKEKFRESLAELLKEIAALDNTNTTEVTSVQNPGDVAEVGPADDGDGGDEGHGTVASTAPVPRWKKFMQRLDADKEKP